MNDNRTDGGCSSFMSERVTGTHRHARPGAKGCVDSSFARRERTFSSHEGALTLYGHDERSGVVRTREADRYLVFGCPLRRRSTTSPPRASRLSVAGSGTCHTKSS